jgi:hypothetical protein
LVLCPIQEGIRQKGLEIASPSGVRRALELQQGQLAQILDQPGQDLPGPAGQLPLFLLQKQEVDLQRFLTDGDFFFQVIMAAELPAQQAGQQRMPPVRIFPG